MITEYIDAAMSRARYEIIDDEEPYYGEVPDLEGIWATIWPESRLHLPLNPTQANVAPVETLNAYPAPFVYNSTLSSTAFVLPEADLQIWKEAMRVATFIGDRSNGPVSMLNVFFYNQIFLCYI